MVVVHWHQCLFLVSYVIETGVCFLTLSEKAFSKRAAFSFLEDIASEFLREYGDRVATDYGIFEIVQSGNGYDWKLTEIWKYQSETFETVSENPLQCS